MSEIATEARHFARGCHHGVLSSLSRRLDGFPFGSVSPFILDHQGCPVILISDIAEHTKNLHNDSRCSLIMQPFARDMHSTGRITVIGHAGQLPEKEALGSRYLRFFPGAADYFAMHDFKFWRIEPARIRWIGGFGRIHWLEPTAWKFAGLDILREESAVIAHMNHNHRNSLNALARALFGIDTDNAELIGCDAEGFDLRVAEDVFRHNFEMPLATLDAFYTIFFNLIPQCR